MLINLPFYSILYLWVTYCRFVSPYFYLSWYDIEPSCRLEGRLLCSSYLNNWINFGPGNITWYECIMSLSEGEGLVGIKSSWRCMKGCFRSDGGWTGRGFEGDEKFFKIKADSKGWLRWRPFQPPLCFSTPSSQPDHPLHD